MVELAEAENVIFNHIVDHVNCELCRKLDITDNCPCDYNMNDIYKCQDHLRWALYKLNYGMDKVIYKSVWSADDVREELINNRSNIIDTENEERLARAVDALSSDYVLVDRLEEAIVDAGCNTISDYLFETLLRDEELNRDV